MTSQKSSVNVFWFTFLNNIKSHLIIPLLTLAGLSVFYPVLSAVMIKSINAQALKNPEFKITDYYKYILTADDVISGGFNIIIPFIAVFMSIALGAVMFNFITKKKTVNVYYSLGITRSKMFIATYLSGITMMFLAIAVPFLIDLLINIKVFGYTAQLGKSILFLAVSCFTVFLISFTVTALVMSLVGTTFEGTAYATLFMLTPQILSFCIEQLMNFFLFGSKYSIANTNFMYNAGISASFSNDYSFLVPTNFLKNGMSNYGVLTKEGYIHSSSYYSQDLSWAAPAYSSIIGWIVVSAVIFIAGLYLYKRRKAEIAGFLGINKVVNFIVTFIAGFAIFIFCFYIMNEAGMQSNALMTLISLAIFAVFYLIADALMTRNLKSYVRGLVKLPAHLGLALLICLVFYSGLFGYSSKVPDVDTIKSAELSIPAGYLTKTNCSYSNSADVSLSYMNNIVKGFDSEADLKMVTSLHKQIIADGKQNFNGKDVPNQSDDVIYGNIYIKYTLNNGDTVIRYYDTLKASTLIKLLEIEQSENYKEQVQSIFTEAVKKSDPTYIKDLKTLVQGASNSDILLNANLLDNITPVKLSGESRKELLSCIATDLANQTYQERYFPKNKSIGVISFVPANGYNDYLNKKYSEYDYAQGAASSYAYGDTSGEIDYTQYLSTLSNCDDSAYHVILTDDMENTLAFLKKSNLMSYFTPTGKIVSAEIVSSNGLYAASSWLYSYNGGCSYQFFAGRCTKEVYDSNKEYQSDYGVFTKNAYKTTDPDALSSLISASYLSYYSPYDGYYVRYTLANGDKLFMYVPENLIPQKVKTEVSKIKLVDESGNSVKLD